MRKILITGGSGFVGYALARKLIDTGGYLINIIDNLSNEKLDQDFIKLISEKNVEFINHDLTDNKLFSKLDKEYSYIYHFAAIKNVDRYNNNSDKLLLVNSISTLNVLSFAKTLKKLNKLLFASTAEVYSGTLIHYETKIPTDESVNLVIEDVKSEKAAYPISKIFGESVCFNFGRKYKIPITIARYHNVYGPRMGYEGVIPTIFRKLNESNEITLCSLNHSRDFCYIDDIIEMSIRACESEKTNMDILNIGNPLAEVTIKELIFKIAVLMKKDVIVNECQTEIDMVKKRCADISKIVKLVNYTPKYSIDEGLYNTYEWFKKNSKRQ